VPVMSSLLIVYDPLHGGPEAVRLLMEKLGEAPAMLPPPRRIEIPVKYGGPEGPDLERVARHAGLSSEEVVARHSGAEYQVALLGFSPGFPYMVGLPEELATPRLSTPRLQVPAGSVAIAGNQTGIYPRHSPGGWNLIGRTSAKLCDWEREDPFLLRPNDRVAFIRSEIRRFDFPEKRAPLPVEDPVLELRTSGLLTSVQDLGRRGHAHQGVPPSGAMDPLAMRLANLAAGNREGAPALEFAFPGPRMAFLRNASFSLGGADFGAQLNGRPVPSYERLTAKEGEELRFEESRTGQWGYLALAGGISSRHSLGSAATDTRSGLGAPLSAGARLSLEDEPAARGRRVPPDLAPLPRRNALVRFVPALQGPPGDLDGATVTLSGVRDRSGYRTESPEFGAAQGSIPSEGIPPGTIQLPPDGRLIFLLADRPTTGGYQKVAFFASVDGRLIAQSPPGAKLTLRKIEATEARRLYCEREEAIGRL